MAVQVTYPGVYIEEFASGAPIEGVGTSIAAFLGPWKYGTPNEPKKIFSWDEFKREFDDPSGQTEPPADDDYLWYAVRGFFENGGRICYVTRVSNAKAGEVKLDDHAAAQSITPTPAAQRTIEVKARTAKDYGATPITVTVAHVSTAQSTLHKADTTLARTATQGVDVIEVASELDADKFGPNDRIVIDKDGGGTTVAEVKRVDRSLKLIRLMAPLGDNCSANASVKLANPDANTTTLRVVDAPTMVNLAAGSVIELTELGGTPVYATVRTVSPQVTQTLKTWRVTLERALGVGLDLAAGVTLKSQEFNFSISGPRSARYTGLSMNPGHPRYFVSVINNDPTGLVNAYPVEPPNTTPVPFNRPSATVTTLPAGTAEVRSTIGAADYETALAHLARFDDVNIVAAPGNTDHGVQQAIITHCETHMKDRFAVLDSPRGASVTGVAEHRPGVDSVFGYAALYYPWLRVSASEGNRLLLVPPSGHVAGIYARIDNNRGVHKAPAGTEATLNGVLGVEEALTDAEQGDLNMTHGVNVVRVFQAGGRAIVWGARTTATNKNWQYVNIRRLFLFLEESIQEGIRWAVFEPNNTELWQKLKRTIAAFLAQQWRDGALFGASEKDAFYVRIDEAINPPDQRALGRLNIEIGVKPSYPAEFIVVRIGIWQGGSDVTE